MAKILIVDDEPNIVELVVTACKELGHDTFPFTNSQKALDGLYRNQFKLGSDASITAGPVGQGGGITFTTDLMSFSKSKGAFAGVSFEGSVLDVRDSLNNRYYGRKVTPVEILVKQSASNKHADALRAAVKGAAK